MTSDDVPQVPRRRSMLPGASGEVPAVEPQAEPHEATASGDWPTEVMHAPADDGEFVAYEPQAYEQQAYQQQADEQPAPAPAAPAPWYRRPVTIGVAVGLVVAGIGVAVALALTRSDDTVVAASITPSPAASETPSPTPSAEPVTLLDDGIADDAYPPPAPSRGDRYPAAYSMEPWVWDHVGPGWVLATYSPDNYESRQWPPVLYLASPEGALFELKAWPNAWHAVLATWLEDEGKARVEVYNDSDDGGELVTLATGASEPMSFAMSTGRSVRESFAASADGNEVWVATGDDWRELRVEWWSPSNGWSRVPHDTDLAAWTDVSSPSGEYVAFEVYSTGDSGLRSERSGPPGEPRIVVLDVAHLTASLVRPSYGAQGDSWCYLGRITDAGEPILSCRDTEYVALDRHALAKVSPGDVSPLDNLNDQTSVTLTQWPLTLTSEIDSSAVFDLIVAHGDEQVTVLTAGDGLPRDGLWNPRFREVAPGLVLASASDGCALVDVDNAAGAPLVVARGGASVSCVAYGMGS